MSIDQNYHIKQTETEAHQEAAKPRPNGNCKVKRRVLSFRQANNDFDLISLDMSLTPETSNHQLTINYGKIGTINLLIDKCQKS